MAQLNCIFVDGEKFPKEGLENIQEEERKRKRKYRNNRN
jgi:hypothetical protein